MNIVARAQLTFHTFTLKKHLYHRSWYSKTLGRKFLALIAQMVRAFGINPKVGGSSLPQAETFSVSKTLTIFVHVSKMNAVARAQLTFQMLTLLENYIYTGRASIQNTLQQMCGPDSSNCYSIRHESDDWGFESPSGRDIFGLKSFDTFTRTSVQNIYHWLRRFLYRYKHIYCGFHVIQSWFMYTCGSLRCERFSSALSNWGYE